VGDLREIAEALESLAADSGRQISNLESLEGLLASMEDKVLNYLKDAKTDEQLSELERSLDDALKSYRNMGKEQIEALRRQLLERRLLDEAGLLRLSLFYMQ
jgi:hypothetical protein